MAVFLLKKKLPQKMQQLFLGKRLF